MAKEKFEGFHSSDDSIDIKGIFQKFIRYWYLFILTVFVAVSIAFLFNKYTSPVYLVDTTVLVKADKSVDASALLGIGFSNDQQNIENEIGRLTSFGLIYRAVTNLNFEVSYFVERGLVRKELYKGAPFEIVWDSTVPQATGLVYSVNFISNKEYYLETEGELIKKYNYLKKEFEPGEISNVEWRKKYLFGEFIENPYNSFRIILNENVNYDEDIENTYQFVFNNYFSLAGTYSGIDVEPINREASILSISLRSSNDKKAADFLNMLTFVYLQQSLEIKNRIATNTIKFIDSQLTEISDTLRTAEIDLQNFQSSREIMDMSFQSQQVFSNIGELDKQKAELTVKSNYYQNLKNYITKNSENIDNLVAPSAMGIEDPVLNQLVGELIKLYSLKADQLLYSTEKSPTVISTTNQIKSTQNAILGNINNIIQNSDQSLSIIDRRINELSQKAGFLPVTQRELVKYQRKFDLSNNIYTYLLQKRTEAQITEASNLPDNEVIDIARAELSALVFPKTTLNYLIALILGLLFPVAYVLGKDYLNDSINDRKDIVAITNFPIVGEILHSPKDTELVIAESPKSSISESFRSLRTNIQYMSKGKSKVTIMVTADMVGVGKTFISINLASIYAQYGKKTILLGFDLRKPKIYQEFGLSNKSGLTSYLINKASIDEIIQPSVKIDHLDIILSGPVPPNPAELIASEKATELFNELRKRYDYIIIDTPPVGLVTDAFLLMDFSDVNVFLVRQGFTNKSVFGAIIRDIEEKGMKVSIVVNDIKKSKGYGYGYSHGYGYGYGYGYGQGYGYYTDDKSDKKKSFTKRLFNKL